MGQTPITGDADVFFAKLESTYDMITNDAANITFAAGDAIRFTALDSEPVQDWHEINEFNGSPSLEGLVEGKRHGTLSGTAGIRTNAAGTESPLSPIWQAALGGTVAISGGISCTYVMVATTPKSLMILKHNSRESKTELLSGCWIANLKADIPGEGNIPSEAFDGGFSVMSFIYGNPHGDTYAGGTSPPVLLADRQKLNPVGLKLKFGALDNGGAGFLCTAYNATTGVLTITPAVGATTSADVIAAVVPTATFDGTIQGGTACGLSIGGTSLGFISYKDSVVTGIGPLLKEANTARVSGLELIVPRRVTGEILFYFKDENVAYLGDAWNGTTAEVIARTGPNIAGSRIKYISRKAQLKVSKVDAPKSDVATWNATFTDMRYSASNDEYYILED